MIRILIVDDHPIVRAGLRRIAEDDRGIAVTGEAASGDDALAALLRDIFTAAGGTHDDWDEFDRTMREQRRTAVLIAVTRVYSNG